MPCRTLLGLYTLLGAGGKSVESRQAVAPGRSGSGGTRGSAGPGATPSLRRVPSPSLAARWRKSLRRTCSRFSLAPSVSPGTWCAPGCLRAQRLVNFYRLYAACLPRLERVGLLGFQALLGPDGRPWVGRSLGAAGFWSLGGWLPGPRTESFPLPASGPAGRTGLFRCWGQGRESCAHPKPARLPAREATGRPAKERTRTTAMGVAGRVSSERPPQWGEGSLGRDLAGEEELAGTFFPWSGFPAGLKASSEARGAS